MSTDYINAILETDFQQCFSSRNNEKCVFSAGTQVRIRISEIRKSLDISQKNLAARVGLSVPYLAQIESGARNLTAEMQGRIAGALGVPATELVDFDAPAASDEEFLLKAFRSLSPEQRKAWLELARVAAGTSPE